ncbi:epoxyalkane--coenzyme M transferase [Pseudonocardia sp. KRD-169]|uniref:Epoxyalkane--coenzyme M transferase n=2 Tax=Pseudonocardia abyssalis TaxID=2792008 RepID=A0ABS6UNB9_9PSEU|nr:epoxyalkane--coenzyme M transferase [Pseudonocardia abyssalis]MBW0133743.1 epoxyalkane--coenzyme M transferase [Pseudonocardia abyssalis]
MKRNDGRIRTSHGGNLPRPADLDVLLAAPDRDEAAVQARLPSAVQEVVDLQIASGLDVVNDGEYVKAGAAGAYAGYIHARVTGWEVREPGAVAPKRGGVAERDRALFPGVYASGLWMAGSGGAVRPGFSTPGAAVPRSRSRVCVEPVRYVGHDAIEADITALQHALKARDHQGSGADAEGFIAALGPLSLGAGAVNEYYASEEEYLMSVAEVMREEYRAVTDAGLVVQIDEPEFLTTWTFHPEWSVADLRRYLGLAVQVINHAVDGLPTEQVRFHCCWGSGHRPHTTDIEFKHVVDLLVQIDAQCYAFEAGNARHAHEWRVWEDVTLPEGKHVMPGVVSHATDLVEHPELVAERITNFASVLGRENVQAGTDCGIGSRVGHEEIVWAKLRSLGEGARIAGARLWA